jgi:hypothetical protein
MTNTGDANLRPGPINPLLKLLIFTNNGSKIKEVGTE